MRLGRRAFLDCGGEALQSVQCGGFDLFYVYQMISIVLRRLVSVKLMLLFKVDGYGRTLPSQTSNCTFGSSFRDTLSLRTRQLRTHSLLLRLNISQSITPHPTEVKRTVVLQSKLRPVVREPVVAPISLPAELVVPCSLARTSKRKHHLIQIFRRRTGGFNVQDAFFVDLSGRLVGVGVNWRL